MTNTYQYLSIRPLDIDLPICKGRAEWYVEVGEGGVYEFYHRIKLVFLA